MKRTIARILATMLLAAVAGLAAAQPSSTAAAIGYVKTLTGQAWADGPGGTMPLQVGSPVQAGAVLRTSADGSLGITLQDNTLMSVGPNSRFAVDEFVYDPGRDQLGLSARLLRGTLHVVTGIIAKLRPESVSVKTPTGLIGVRGTRFAVSTEGV